MTTEQLERESVDQVVAESIARLRRLWPSALGTPDLIREYRRVMLKATGPAMLREVTDAVIDAAGDGYLPRPGVFANAIDRARARRQRDAPRPERTPRWVDEAALRDALAYLEQCGPDDQAHAEEQIRAIRLRLPDRGAALEAEMAEAISYRRGSPRPGDPTGTLRYRVVHPEGAP